MNDFAKIYRDTEVRKRQKRTAGTQDLFLNFQIPIRGEADNGLRFNQTDPIWFNSSFQPKQGAQFPVPPGVFFGFNIMPDSDDVAATSLLGVTGFGNVGSWRQNDDGYYTGAVVQIGVVNLGEVVSERIPYRGVCNVAFVGPGVQSPMNMPNYEFRREH